MPRSRIAVFVLLTLAIAGAAWLWWSTSGGRPTSILPAATHADPAAGTIDVTTAHEVGADHGAAAPERTEAADPVAASEGPGRLRVTAIWPDQAPAAGVMVYLRRSAPPLPYDAFARGLTDADGVVVFTGVPRGPSSLASDRGDRQKVTVEGGPQDVTFELHGGVAVRGTVLDPVGEPVAGAGVWLQSSDTGWSGGRIATFTDASGAFALEHVHPQQSLGAVAADFAPSELVDLDVVDQSRPPVIVELTLLPDGGLLQGTVVAAEGGRPIAGAIVAVGKGPDHLDYRGERVIEQWTVRTAETDDQGSFVIDGLATGPHPVAIRAGGYGLWRTDVTIERHSATVIGPRLERAATLSGTVTDGNGHPLDQAAIRVYDRAPRTPFVAGGQIDFDETFGYRAALAGPDGKYRVEEVTPGTVHVFAQRHRDPRQGDGTTVAYTQAELQIAAGSEARWDPVIDDGLSIEGRVLYADGFPIPGLFITLADEKEGGKQHLIVSGRDGVFRFLCLENSTYEIRVQLPFDAPKGAAPIKATGVIPNRGRTELRATFDQPVKQENGIVVGRIDDAAGRIRNANAATITLHSDDRWFRPGIKIENGAFRVDRVQPCRFRLALMEDEIVLAETDWFELLPAATVDAGVLRTEPAGAARITVTRGEGTEAFEPKLYLRREETGGTSTIQLGRRTEVLADNLTPGPYSISAHCKGMVTVTGKVDVVAGQTTPVALSLQAGAPLRCEVWWPEGETKSRSRTYRILDSAGKVLYQFEGALSTVPTRPYPLRYTLPLGHWRIEFSTDDGLHGEVEVEVKNATDAVEARIDLK